MSLSNDLTESFRECLDGTPREVADQLKEWFTAERRDHLVTVFEELGSRFRKVPLTVIFDAILKIKYIEAYSQIGENLSLSDLQTALKRSSRGLISVSIYLDRVAPIKLHSGEQMSWTEIGDHLRAVSEIIQELWIKDKEFPHLVRKGGPSPKWFQNVLLFLIWDVIKKSTGKNHYDAVAGIFSAVGYSQELDADSCRQRLNRLKKTLESQYRSDQ